MLKNGRRGLAAIAAVGFMLVFSFVPTANAGGGSHYRIQLDARPPVGQPWSFLRYFPLALSVHRGDVVNASWNGVGTPHTATVIPSGNPDAWRAENQGPGGPQDPSTYPYALQVPDPAVGGDDNEVVVNPAVLAPSDPGCGTVGSPCTFDGTSVVNSGFRFSTPGSEPSFFVHVIAPVGQYSFLCLIHPGMQLSLNVVPDATTIPSPAAVADTLQAQVTASRNLDGPIADALAQTKIKTPLSNGHQLYTTWAGGFWRQVSADEYRDNGLTVNVGDRIRVLGNFEIHTATFPKSAADTVPFITPQCEVPGPDTPASSPADCASPADFQIAFNPKAVVPTANQRLISPLRFVNSGLLAYPGSHTFTAAAPGTYSLVCLVHGPSMTMTVRVR